MKDSVATPKADTYEAHSPSARKEKRKTPDSENCHEQLDTSQIPRTRRRTYSRNRRISQVHSQGQLAHQNDMPPSTKTLDHEGTEKPDSASKRARVPTSPQTRHLTKADSRCFERKTSPTSLASGNSRHSSMNGSRTNNQRGPARGGRKTRGKYLSNSTTSLVICANLRR
ncbi:hypothetical protein BDV26DRAFT_266055 [Aspergillus bertholletiae]|uniref:Uncharacterized protein n=1 Tax=Aspergillus bertholletiae TaxID=1226010 RepID=A0A5N7B4H0_9EURO|nr:hypothetical protein BDV26DRAFT_266055 [Aspergillus bertholletiae]